MMTMIVSYYINNVLVTIMKGISIQPVDALG